MEQYDPRSARHSTETTGNEFFSPTRRSPVFDPAGQYRRSMAGQTETPEEARKRRRSRRRTVNRIVGVGLLVTLGVGGWVAYEPVSAKVKAYVLEAMVQEMNEVADAEQNYRTLYSTFTTDRSQLTLAEDGFNDVRIQSADSRGFCLVGDSLLSQRLFYTPTGGISETPCV